jgi:Ser/Thr protein kinase RdoA (MazF antagonist)
MLHYDLTFMDAHGWEAIKKSLNQRVVVVKERLVPSRHNRVWIVETDVRPVVVKLSLSGKAPDEFEFLIRGKRKDLNVPFPMHMEDGYLVMEYISGEPCDLLINHMFSLEAAEKLGVWLARFHESMSDSDSDTIMADAVLSNFVMREGEVYGFDFESSGRGEPLDDLGQLATSILGSEPYFIPIKFDLARRMLLGYEKQSGMEVVESVRPYVSKHLEQASFSKPLFRRTFSQVASGLRRGWPRLA